jgi:uncharacterized protein YkwD
MQNPGKLSALCAGLALALIVLMAPGTAQAGCARPDGAGSEIKAVLASVNAERASRGLRPLRLSSTLSAAAQNHACTMVATGRFSHTGPDGSSPKVRARRAGCRTRLTAENIAMGYSSADRTMDLWMHSSGHRRNILLPSVDMIGIGLAAPRPGQGGGPRWVQVFARGC